MELAKAPPVPPLAEWKVSLALLACVMAACATLNVVLTGIGWWFAALVSCGIVLGSAALVRPWVSNRVVPSLVAFVALFGYLTQQFAAETTLMGLFPTWDTLGRMASLLARAQNSIQQQTVPADAGPGILFMLVGGIGLVALVCDVVAVAFGRRALAGVAILVVLWIPAFTVQRDFDLFWVIVTAVSFLYLLRVGSPVPGRRLSNVIGAGALALALVAQLVLPSTEPAQAGGAGNAISTGSHPIVSLGNDLRRDLDRRALTYSTESGQPQYLRLVSLDQFDGQKWYASEPKLDPAKSPEKFARPPGLSGGVDRTNEVSWIQVANLESPWLPLPYPSKSVNGLGGAWSWDPASLSLRTNLGSSKFQDYRVDSYLLHPTPEQLLNAGSVVPSAVAPLAVIHQPDVPAIIGDTARAVAGNAGSHYEQALALQQFLRNGDFVYSEKAPVEEGYDGTGLDVIATFLKVKSGYCVHFASAMALMARTLGIPARVAVGFLPGKKLDERLEGRPVYEVTSHDLHAWPELYFDGVGWLPFEPTTGRGVVPDYANASVPGVPVTGAGGANATPPPTSSAAPSDALGRRAAGNGGGTGTAAAASTGIPWLIALAVLALLAAAAPALVRWVERRSRLRAIRRGFAPATVGWLEVLQSAEDVGITVPNTATPREGGRMLVEAIAGGPPEEEEAIARGASAVERIVELIEREGYARPGGGASVSAEDVATAISRLRLAVGWRATLRSFLLPPSLWRRVVEAFRPEGRSSY